MWSDQCLNCYANLAIGRISFEHTRGGQRSSAVVPLPKMWACSSSSRSSIPSFPERLSTLVIARWPWQLISSGSQCAERPRVVTEVIHARNDVKPPGLAATETLTQHTHTREGPSERKRPCRWRRRSAAQRMAPASAEVVVEREIPAAEKVVTKNAARSPTQGFVVEGFPVTWLLSLCALGLKLRSREPGLFTSASKRAYSVWSRSPHTSGSFAN